MTMMDITPETLAVYRSGLELSVQEADKSLANLPDIAGIEIVARRDVPVAFLLELLNHIGAQTAEVASLRSVTMSIATCCNCGGVRSCHDWCAESDEPHARRDTAREAVGADW